MRMIKVPNERKEHGGMGSGTCILAEKFPSYSASVELRGEKIPRTTGEETGDEEKYGESLGQWAQL